MATGPTKKKKTTSRKPSAPRSGPQRSSKTKTAAKPRTNRSASANRTTSTPSKAKNTKSGQKQPQVTRTPLSAERKADITGIVLIVIGLLTLLSALIAQSGQLTRWWTNFLQTGIGWGAYALPLILL
ncbi:hypothetical protein GX865_07755, partial [Candidatus Saccharibacteria bacterium]|nr:hypothetical protein [Candidatus Saccharibacteria bacterium]